MLLGPQWPPHALVPESYTTAAARELVEFGAMYGQPVDDWQGNVLEIGCGEQRDGTWAAQEVFLGVQRQNGKGGVFETRALGGLYLFGERHLIYTAHVIDTAKNSFKRVVELVTNYDDLRRRVARINKTNSEEAVELLGGATLQFRTRGQRAGKGRGFTCDTLFLDEALYLQQELLDGLLPTILARTNPQIWYLSTPPEDPQAALMKIRDDGLAGVPGMAMALWANDPGADLSDLAVLAHANPAWGIRLNAQVMTVLERRLGPEGYARECGGVWPVVSAGQWLVITESQWTDRRDRQGRLEGRVAVAVDVTPDRAWSAIGAGGARAGGGRLVGVVDHRPGTGWVVPALLGLEERKPLVVVVNDGKLADDAELAGLEVYRPTAGDMVTACTGFFDGIAGAVEATRDLWHLGEAELTAAVAGAAKRTRGEAWSWDRRLVSTDICPLMAVSLAQWGHSTPKVHRQIAQPFFAAWR